MSEQQQRWVTARFVLDAASAAGIKLGTNGKHLDALCPRGLDREVWHKFYDALSEYQQEIIALILAEPEGVL